MSFKVRVTEDSVSLHDDKGEIVYWDKQEWVDDPTVVFAIVNAVRLGYTRSGEYLRSRMANKVG